MENFTHYAIIVAGGSGKRMGNDIPKQFLLLDGKPILMYTIEKFYHSLYKPQIIVVIAEHELETWKSLQQQYHFNIPHQIVFGGKERFFSVQHALAYVSNKDAVVAIHDAVRPLISLDTINHCFAKASKKGNAIASTIAKDSIRIIQEEQNKAIPRNLVYIIQTPQVFKFEQLEVAYKQEFTNDFTDDASVVEKAGYVINLEEGDLFNLKITFKEDLILAEALLNN